MLAFSLSPRSSNDSRDRSEARPHPGAAGSRARGKGRQVGGWVCGGCGGLEGRTFMRERAGLFMLHSPKSTALDLPLGSLSVLCTSGVSHRSSLGGLSGPEVRRNTSGASGCVEGLQARALSTLVPAQPDALPLASSCWGPNSSKKESHPEPHVLTTSYRDTVLSRADLPNWPSPQPT